jgi:hypothetical protein
MPFTGQESVDTEPATRIDWARTAARPRKLTQPEYSGPELSQSARSSFSCVLM